MGGSGWLGMRSSALLEDAGVGSSREVIGNVVLYLIQCYRVPLGLGHAVEAVKSKLKLPRAAARAKDLQARHIVFCISSNGAFSAMAQDFFDEVKDHAKKQGLDHMGVSLIERHSVSFTTRFWNTFWSQRINASIGAVGANRILQILAADRHLSHRLVTGSKDAAPVHLIHGRFGYGVPKAKQNSIALDEVEDNIADYLPAAAYPSVLEEGAASHPQPAAAPPSALPADPSPVGDIVEPASSVEHATEDPGGGADSNVPGNGSINPTELGLDDPGGGTADDDPGGGSVTSAECDSALIVLNTSKTSSSPLPSSFATGLTSSRDSSSIMAKKLVSDDSDDEGVVYKGDLGIPDVDDCATGSFCSSCAIPPRVAGGLLSAGVGGEACYFDPRFYFPFGVIRLRGRG